MLFRSLSHDHSPLLRYEGDDLRRDLIEAYRQETSRCSVTYAASDGTARTLSFEDVRQRLFDLSFDPYHCVERRWGAKDQAELATCRDGPDKAAWYLAQRTLRNQIVRTYGEPMGWSLPDFHKPGADIGMPEPPDVDVVKVLEGGGHVQVATARQSRRRR